MDNEKIIMPTKEEVEKLLTVAMNDKGNHMQTVGELLGMKLIDLLLPNIRGGPEWDYYGLRIFFDENGIASSDTFEEALKKLK